MEQENIPPTDEVIAENCTEFVELLRKNYRPSAEPTAIVFTTQKLLDRFQEIFDYRPSAEAIRDTMLHYEFKQSMVKEEDNFVVGWQVQEVS